MAKGGGTRVLEVKTARIVRIRRKAPESDPSIVFCSDSEDLDRLLSGESLTERMLRRLGRPIVNREAAHVMRALS